ncbi:MAG: cyclic nucleotide-binding domain-containing protein [Acidobacteriota bacterium]
MHSVDVFDRLREFEILSHLDGELLDLLASCTSPVTYETDSMVIQEGEKSQDIYFVDRGEIDIQRNTPYGRYTLAKLEGGAVFGETSFIDRHARSGDARAASDSVLFPISASALRPLIRENQRFSLALHWALWKSLSQKLRKTNEVLANFFAKGGTKRTEDRDASQKGGDFKVGIGAKRDLFREQTLSPMEINFLSTLSKEKKVAAGEYIFREGEKGDRLYVVLEGRVMISKEIVGSGEEALAFLERGDYFGEMALIDKQPRSADAKAADDGTVVLMISSEVLEGILDIQKVSSLRLLTILSGLIAKRLREIDDKLVGWYIFSAGSGESLGLPG